MSSHALAAPPDKAQRERALDPALSVLVRAPAGSGKTDLLTRRFLRLLAEVDDPAEIVAITFTRAAAAEMRHRILSEIEKAAASAGTQPGDEFSMQALAQRVVERSRDRNWNLLDLPAQLRISTIDSFCRLIALREPLLSTLGGGLDVSEESDALYRRAARSTLEQIGNSGQPALSRAIEMLLLWRDNNWQELEDQLVKMLATRDRWMQDFWLGDFAHEDEARWEALRGTLERPFARAAAKAVAELARLVELVPGACDEILALARFACAQSGNTLHRDLAELAEFPCGPFASPGESEHARNAWHCLADFLLTSGGTFRKAINVSIGFPPNARSEKQRMQQLIERLAEIQGFESALAGLRALPPARYTDEDWQIVRACFTLLRHAAAQLQVAFAEAGTADYVEVAQAALHVLEADDHQPSDAAMVIADGIRHLLVDEFQDTSRRQHRLIGALAAAWPDSEGRTLFVVGDPMQSIYFFRDADAELFPRVQSVGLELPGAAPLHLDPVLLESNFRTAPELVNALNDAFDRVFAFDDGSGVRFSSSLAARSHTPGAHEPFSLHLEFVPQIPRGGSATPGAKEEAKAVRDEARRSQLEEIVDLIRGHLERMEQARARDAAYRIAVLGRTYRALAPIAAALREAAIPFRAVDLEPLSGRPEVLDALSLARALFNAEDRIAWLGVLRAPWCGLSLDDLYLLCGDRDPALLKRPIPALLRERASLLRAEGRAGVERVMQAANSTAELRAALPTASLGTWLQQVWLLLGGDACVDETQRINLNLLWRCLDNIPDGEPGLLGPALDAALKNLTAQPDPAAAGECGVQLMSIHKAKGLEFEVVIVPDLHAGCGGRRNDMFSWLERGLAEPEESGEITEFLIAPFHARSGEKGRTREWVDRQYHAREDQEDRRVFYVAATRAREELHFFARPAYKIENGALTLCDPAKSLLSTAWPALEEEVRARFDEWQSSGEEEQVDAIAASAEVLTMPSPLRPALLRRLPPGFAVPAPLPTSAAQPGAVGAGAADLYRRHEGGLLSRALGTAVHALFEELARLRSECGTLQACAQLASFVPRIVARIRGAGVPLRAAETLAAEALDIATRAAHDPVVEWILSPHPDAESEVRWAGVIAGDLHTVQVDRVFRAGALPGESGENAWWIVDWKSTHADGIDPGAALPRLRTIFAPQLELYAEVLRKLRGSGATIRAGLYYPRMLKFDWWEL